MGDESTSAALPGLPALRGGEGLDTRLMRGAVAGRMFGAAPPRVRIGRFEIERRLGEGGMGQVFAARDPQLDRIVAVKLVRPDPARRADYTAMLLREARALGRMVHPNVVTIYDSGVHEGEVFLAMEYFDGGTLARWIADHPVRRRADVDAVLDRFVTAGRGLAAAHAIGLVHRDFKPANVLLAKDGRIAVADFGLAGIPREAASGAAPGSSTALTETTGTQSGGGTPGYMAPEQLLGRADARSDQYAFCVSLYEALVGIRPDQLARGTGSADAASLRSRAAAVRGVPRWLREALLRGLAIDPDARFGSMDALLLALDRHRRTARRRTVALLGIGAAAVAATVLARRPTPCVGMAGPDAVWSPSHADQIAQAFAATTSSMAASATEAVAAAFDPWARAWAQQRREACEATHGRGEATLERFALRMDCLDRAKLDADAVFGALLRVDGESIGATPDVLARLPALGRCEDPEALASGDVVAPEDRPAYERLFAEVARAGVEVEAGRAAEAQRILDAIAPELAVDAYPVLGARARLAEGRALAITATIAAAREVLTDATRKAMTTHDDALVVACIVELAGVIGSYDRRSAEDALRWLDIAAGLLRSDDADARLRDEVVLARVSVLRRSGQRDEAEGEARRALAGPIDPRVAAGLRTGLVSLLVADARFAEAIAVGEEAVALAEEAFGAESAPVESALDGLASAYAYAHRQGEALESASRSVELSARLYGPRSRWAAGARGLRARMLLEAAQPGLALVEAGLAFSFVAADADPGGISVAGAILAQVLAEHGSFAEAAAVQRVSLRHATEAFGPRSILYAQAQVNLSGYLVASGRAEEGLARVTEVLPLLERDPADEESLEAAEAARGNAALALGKLGRHAEALAFVDATIAAHAERGVGDSDTLARHYRSRATLLDRLGRHDDMRAAFRRSIDIFDRVHAKPTMAQRNALIDQATALHRLGDHRDAAAAIVRVLEFDAALGVPETSRAEHRALAAQIAAAAR